MPRRIALATEVLEWPRRLVVVGFIFVGLWYLGWRTGTLNPGAPILSTFVYAAEIFGFITALLHIFMCWSLSVRKPSMPRSGMTVDVFIPTYDEATELVRETLIAALAMDYPHGTWLLDDARREEMRALASELGCGYLTREDNLYAKAGNLNHALAHSSSDFVAVFDADHAPRRDFLTKTLGYFEDGEVAFVQTPQDYYNLDSYQHRKRGVSKEIWTEQALFFRVIQRGKDRWNAAFFCGSCAIVRRSALDRIGGFATETVTEDLHTSIRLHRAGFRSIYHAEPLAFGLAPGSIEPFITQRVRWGQGAMHVWRKEGILFNRGLSWPQRLNYFASALTYFDGWQKMVFYVAPIVVLISGRLPLLTTMPQFLVHFVPYYVLTFWAFEEVGRGYGGVLYIEQYNMARFAAFAWATLALCVPKLKFRVTHKRPLGHKALRFSAAQICVLAGNAIAIGLGTALYLDRRDLPMAGFVANVVWAAINCGFAGAVVHHVLKVQRSRRAHYRFPVPVPAQLDFGGSLIRGVVDDLSAHGFRFYGLIPPNAGVGTAFKAKLILPGGPLELQGQVRGLIEGPKDAGKPGGCHGAFCLRSDQQQRLEGFLFGTNLQWLVNGYRDQSDTPLSRLFPSLVPGPKQSPFSNVHWNAAEMTLGANRSVETLMSFGTDTRSLWMLSFTPLPERQAMSMNWFRNRDGGVYAVRLERAFDYEQNELPLFVYHVEMVSSDDRLWESAQQDARRQVA